MKKIFVIILAASLAVLMAGCGAEESTTSEDTTVQVVSNADLINDGDSDHENFYLNLQGDWQDSTSQRASAIIKSLGYEQGVTIKVSWGNSAEETTVWTMTAKASDSNGALVYTDCKKAIVSESGEEVIYENGEGSFDFVGGKLLWTGAADENCKTCVFEKLV